MKKELKLNGMTCPACKAIVEDICGDYSEITSVNADVTKNTLTVEFNESFDLTPLKKEIESETKFKLEL